MIIASDRFHTRDLGRCYAILASSNASLRSHYLGQPGVTEVPQGFSYNSGTNADLPAVEQLRTLISQHVEPDSGD